jgi:Domain of unknown function (DUF4124)
MFGIEREEFVMKRWLPLSLMALVLLTATIVFVWTYRHHVMERSQPETSPEATAQTDVLYRWVDAEGVTHYGSQPTAKAEKVVFDGRRITPLDSAVLEQQAEKFAAATELATQKTGNALMDLRAELAENQEKMRAAKAAMNDL